MGAGNSGNAVPQIGHKRLDVQCNQRFILDDHHFGLNLLGDLPAGLVQQVGYPGFIRSQDNCSFIHAEPFNGHEQKRLPGTRSDCFELAACGLLPMVGWQRIRIDAQG